MTVSRVADDRRGFTPLRTSPWDIFGQKMEKQV